MKMINLVCVSLAGIDDFKSMIVSIYSLSILVTKLSCNLKYFVCMLEDCLLCETR